MKVTPWFLTLASLAASNAFCLHFVAYGDTRTNSGTHQAVVDGISKVNPELIIFSGDLWDGYGPEKFKEIMMKNANIANLLNKNLFLVSRGNHEGLDEMLEFKPSLVRNGKELYSFTQGNSFFISLAMDPAKAVTFLEQQLQTPEAKAATWKFVYSHYPVYSTGEHGSTGIPAVEKICDKYGVNIVFNGHDHIYERTHQMYGSKVVDNGNALTAEKGTVYIVSGGGGAPLYSVGKAAFTHFAKSANNFTDIVTDEKQLTVRALSPAGAVIDAFTITKGTTGIAFGSGKPSSSLLGVNVMTSNHLAIVTFPPVQGNEGVLEIRSSDGSMQSREALSGGQTSAGWNYAGLAKGEYMASFRDGQATMSGKISITR